MWHVHGSTDYPMQSQKISCPDSLDRQYLRQYLGIYKILLPTSHTSKSSMWPNGLSPLMRWLAIVLSAYASEVVNEHTGQHKQQGGPCAMLMHHRSTRGAQFTQIRFTMLNIYDRHFVSIPIVHKQGKTSRNKQGS